MARRKPTTDEPQAIQVQDGLTNLQRLFIDNYFIHNLNGTEAVLATFDTTDRAVAAAMASEYLRIPKIRARVNARLDEFHLSADEVLARLAYHARGSMEDFVDADSGTIDLAKARRAKQLGLIRRFKTKFTTTTKTHEDGTTEETEVSEVEIELYDAQAALVHLGKHLNLFSSDININILQCTDDELEQLAAGKKLISVEAQR